MSTTSVSRGASRLPQGLAPAMWGQWFGFMLDSYDMSLVVVMAPILTKVFTSGKGSAAWQYTVILLTYSMTMAARPVGSAIFGHFADKIGRKTLLFVTMSGVGVCSLAMAFLPTYATAGELSYVLLILLRLVVGIFFGGEYAVGHTFAIEFSPIRIRGFIGGFVQSGFPFGFVMGSVMVAVLNTILGKADMIAFGWRIAFASGIVPVFAGLAIRYFTKESPIFKKAHDSGDVDKTPFFSLFKPPALWNFLQVFFLMCGLFLTDYAIYGFLPKILTRGGNGFDVTTYAWIYGFALFLAFLGYIFYGWLSDYVGRRRLTLIYCPIIVIFGIPAFYFLHASVVALDLRIAIFATVLVTMLKLAWGMLPAYLCERFPTKRRAVGLGFGYSSGALIGAWFSIYVFWVHQIPFIGAIEGKELWLSPAVIMVIGAAITFLAMYFGPETKNMSLEDVQ